jgi:hypothetical protein
VQLGDPTVGDDDFGDGLAVESPHRVGPGQQFRVDAGDQLAFRGPPTPDHGVNVMAARRARGRDVHLGAQAILIGIQDERAEAAANVEYERLRSFIPRGGVVEGGFDNSALERR